MLTLFSDKVMFFLLLGLKSKRVYIFVIIDHSYNVVSYAGRPSVVTSLIISKKSNNFLKL